jgi:hypothetical protein
LKYIPLSLSLWLCSYSVSALESSEFNIPNYCCNKEHSSHLTEKSSILEAIRTAQNNLKSFPNQLDTYFGSIAITQHIGELWVMAEQKISMLKTSKEFDNT